MWRKFYTLNPNYSDYFRNAAWSISCSILVTFGLKIENWGWFALALLLVGFFSFSITAACLTAIANFIKKYQTKYSDLKLITRTKNKFEPVGPNFFNDVHVHRAFNNIKNYPDFIELHEYLDNVSAYDETEKSNYPRKLKLALFFAIFGVICIACAGVISRIDHAQDAIQTTYQPRHLYTKPQQLTFDIDTTKKL